MIGLVGGWQGVKNKKILGTGKGERVIYFVSHIVIVCVGGGGGRGM